MRAPAGAGVGSAKVVLTFAACEDLDILPGVFEVPVGQAAAPGQK